MDRLGSLACSAVHCPCDTSSAAPAGSCLPAPTGPTKDRHLLDPRRMYLPGDRACDHPVNGPATGVSSICLPKGRRAVPGRVLLLMRVCPYLAVLVGWHVVGWMQRCCLCQVGEPGVQDVCHGGGGLCRGASRMLCYRAQAPWEGVQEDVLAAGLEPHACLCWVLLDMYGLQQGQTRVQPPGSCSLQCQLVVCKFTGLAGGHMGAGTHSGGSSLCLYKPCRHGQITGRWDSRCVAFQCCAGSQCAVVCSRSTWMHV